MYGIKYWKENAKDCQATETKQEKTASRNKTTGESDEKTLVQKFAAPYKKWFKVVKGNTTGPEKSSKNNKLKKEEEKNV